jgi:hypothetical protein
MSPQGIPAAKGGGIPNGIPPSVAADCGSLASPNSRQNSRSQDWVLPAAMERARRKLAGADDVGANFLKLDK